MQTLLSFSRGKQQFTAGLSVIGINQHGSENPLEYLHPMELTNYRNFIHQERKNSYLFGRMCSKKAIQLISPIVPEDVFVDSGVFQFPIVRQPHSHQGNLQVSIAHCQDTAAAIAFREEHPLGIDIERIDHKLRKELLSVLSKAELNLLENWHINNLIGFTMVWTMKEALTKILRTGLTLDFSISAIDNIEVEHLHFTAYFKHFIQYKAISWTTGMHVYSIVLPRNSTFQNIDALGTA